MMAKLIIPKVYKPKADYAPETNEERVVGVQPILVAFARKTGLDPRPKRDGPVTVAGDMIAHILHWVEANAGREAALDAVKAGLSHYVTESNIDYSREVVDELGPDASVEIAVNCNGETWSAWTATPSTITGEKKS